MKEKNMELSAAFQDRIALSEGRLMTLTASDGTTYKSYFTNSLFHSCGYNHPEIIQEINHFIKKHRTEATAVRPGELAASIADNLSTLLPKSLGAVRFSEQNIYQPILNVLSDKYKNPVFLCLEKPSDFPDTYQNRLYTLLELLGEDEHADIHAVTQTVFPTEHTIRVILKKRRASIAGFIINPVLHTDGSLIDADILKWFIPLLNKYHIPIIWDDTEAGFFRTGPAFSFNHYQVKPDILLINSNLSGNRAIHLAAMSKKQSKAIPENCLSATSAMVPSLIMFSAVLDFLKKGNFEQRCAVLQNRMNGKYRAMMANTQHCFNVSGKGLLYFIRTNSHDTANHLIQKLDSKKMLLIPLKETPSVLYFAPPLIISEEEIDTLLQEIRLFFESEISA